MGGTAEEAVPAAVEQAPDVSVEDPERAAYEARMRFLSVMNELGLEVTSGAVQRSQHGEFGVRLGVVAPTVLDRVSALLEADCLSRRLADLLSLRTARGCEP